MWLLDLFGSGSGNLKSQNLKSVPPCACFHGFFSWVLGFPVTMLDTLVHITAMFNVHIRIGHRWNKGQRVLLPQNSVFVLQSRVCEKMSFEKSKRVGYIGRHSPYNLMLSWSQCL